MIVGIAVGVISICKGLPGFNCATVSACASYNIAIVYAFDTIKFSKAMVMTCGDPEAYITETTIEIFNYSKALLKQNDDAHGASMLFD